MHRDCLLTAFDHTHYEEIIPTEYSDPTSVLVEFMCYLPYSNDEVVPINKSKKIVIIPPSGILTHDDRKYLYMFEKDGRYSYHKYLLYTKDHPLIKTRGGYMIEDKIFYHDGKIYLGLANIPWYEEFILTSENSKVIYNWYDLREYISAFIEYFYEKELFTICKLDRCLFELQRKIFFDGLKNCDFGACSLTKQLKLQRDFLFASVYVLKYLIDIGNYLEAQRIIESLATCGGLCDDSLGVNHRRCNCG